MDTFNHPLDGDIGSGLYLSNQGRGELQETARWGRFIAIVSFVFIGFMVLAALFFGFMGSGLLGAHSPISGLAFTFFYLIGAAITFIPALFLYRFAQQARVALATDDQTTLDRSLASLKSLFRFYGILLAVALLFYGLMLVFGILGGAASLMF